MTNLDFLFNVKGFDSIEEMFFDKDTDYEVVRVYQEWSTGYAEDFYIFDDKGQFVKSVDDKDELSEIIF